MSDPKRYAPSGPCKYMTEDPYGNWVDLVDHDQLKAERDAMRAENLGMVAQRMAYASEFPLGKDGLPDTGSIHQNIRKLKAEKDELVAALKRIDGMFIRGMVSDSWTTGAIAGEIAHEALAKHRGE